jgi:hypothetical protein
MRFKTFRNVLLFGALGAGGLGFYGLNKLFVKKEPASVPAASQAAAPTQLAPEPAVPVAPAPLVSQDSPAASSQADPEALRPMDEEILKRVALNISGDKAKDVFSGKPYKVSLYKDAGQTRVNRLKIDLNRNEKWEEKWTFATDNGKEVVKRQVAPNDDEKYTIEYRLDGNRWRKK